MIMTMTTEKSLSCDGKDLENTDGEWRSVMKSKKTQTEWWVSVVTTCASKSAWTYFSPCVSLISLLMNVSSVNCRIQEKDSHVQSHVIDSLIKVILFCCCLWLITWVNAYLCDTESSILTWWTHPITGSAGVIHDRIRLKRITIWQSCDFLNTSVRLQSDVLEMTENWSTCAWLNFQWGKVSVIALFCICPSRNDKRRNSDRESRCREGCCSTVSTIGQSISW